MGGALIRPQDGAAAIGVDDRDVEPGTLFEELHVVLHVGAHRGQPDEEDARTLAHTIAHLLEGYDRIGWTKRSPFALAHHSSAFWLTCSLLGARLSFILGIYGNLGRQTAEPTADVPAALAAI